MAAVKSVLVPRDWAQKREVGSFTFSLHVDSGAPRGQPEVGPPGPQPTALRPADRVWAPSACGGAFRTERAFLWGLTATLEHTGARPGRREASRSRGGEASRSRPEGADREVTRRSRSGESAGGQLPVVTAALGAGRNSVRSQRHDGRGSACWLKAPRGKTRGHLDGKAPGAPAHLRVSGLRPS